MRHTSGGLRGVWRLLRARAGHVEEAVVALVHVLEHLEEEGTLLTRCLEFRAHELHLLTEGVHHVLKSGRSLTFMDRCPWLFMDTVHGLFILCTWLCFVDRMHTVHGRPCTFFQAVHEGSHADKLGTIDHAIGGGT